MSSAGAGAGGGGGSAGGRPPAVRLGGDPPSPWEGVYGFCRVVRFGDFAVVGGTTSVNIDGVVGGDTPYAQTVEILRKLSAELSRVGASLADVIQTRMYVTDISRADEVGRAHSEAFDLVRPVSTMVEVSALIDPRMLVEIEAVAWVGPG